MDNNQVKEVKEVIEVIEVIEVEEDIVKQQAVVDALLVGVVIEDDTTIMALLKQEHILQLMKQGQQEYVAYEPTLEQIQQRKAILQADDQEDNWTDATQSVADEDDIWVVDDDIAEAMDLSDEEQGEDGQDEWEEEQEQLGASSEVTPLQLQEQQKKRSQLQVQKEQAIIAQLEQQFITGNESNHHGLLGKHDSFCVSTRCTKDLLFSGGGDDCLHIYSRVISGDLMRPIHTVKHTETITKIDVTYNNSHAFSLTEKELLLTDLTDFMTRRIPLQNPIDLACHKMGGVVAIANGFNIDVYNVKGMALYNTFYLDMEIARLLWLEGGKQLVAVCEDKLRIVTVKNSEIIKVNSAHTTPITSVDTWGNVVVSGSEDGRVAVSNTLKGNTLVTTDQITTSINNLCLAQNYLLCGPLESNLHWFEINKMKRIFMNQLQGSSTDIIPVLDKNTFAVSDIKGYITLYDRRNPMKEINRLKAGNTIHQLSTEASLLSAACEDGCVRLYDLKMIH